MENYLILPLIPDCFLVLQYLKFWPKNLIILKQTHNSKSNLLVGKFKKKEPLEIWWSGGGLRETGEWVGRLFKGWKSKSWKTAHIQPAEVEEEEASLSKSRFGSFFTTLLVEAEAVVLVPCPLQYLCFPIIGKPLSLLLQFLSKQKERKIVCYIGKKRFVRKRDSAVEAKKADQMKHIYIKAATLEFRNLSTPRSMICCCSQYSL